MQVISLLSHDVLSFLHVVGFDFTEILPRIFESMLMTDSDLYCFVFPVMSVILVSV